jgi:GrpB-like predicted nucleotidyltransferase (UPF0157 family)
MKIIIQEYSDIWPTLFESERTALVEVLNDPSILIEHIGSTSVKGLAAKPVIDIIVGLPDFKIAENYIKPITDLNYEYISQFEDIMPYRRFFIKESSRIRTHHIHMVQTDSEFWVRHLDFRDYLRANENSRNEYQDLKKKLSEKEWNNGNEYAAAKSDFISSINQLILKNKQQ